MGFVIVNVIREAIITIGKETINFVQFLGRLYVFKIKTLSGISSYPFYWNNLLRQVLSIGYLSLPIVGLTAIFTGAVLALQTHVGFSRFNSSDAIPEIVIISITRELGPVLIALIVAGRVGASIAAEIGTMRITEQIDALATLATNPIKYLVVPRVIAGTITLPSLVAIANLIGVYGGYLVGVYILDFTSNSYINKTIEFLQYKDVISGLVKATAFGFIITLVGCFYGYNCKFGAQGVGLAATKAVVVSSVLILITNYIITSLFFYGT